MRLELALWAGSLVIVLLATGGSGVVWTGQCANLWDSAGNFVLPYEADYTDDNTPAYCIARCREEQYGFAGVNWLGCHCGRSAPVTTVPMAECDYTCSGDSSKKCGGSGRYNVYAVTGLRPVDCVLEEAGSWSACSSSCGRGTRSKDRRQRTKAKKGGQSCSGKYPGYERQDGGTFRKTEDCNPQPCPVDCILADTAWSSCSATCGPGTRTRDRKRITQDSNGGKTCAQVMDPGSTGLNIGNSSGSDGWGAYFRETQSCNLKECPDSSEDPDFTATPPSLDVVEAACSRVTCDPQIYRLSINSSMVRQENLARIEDINTAGQSWVAGQNLFLGLSYPEVLAYRLGEQPPSPDERQQLPSADSALAAFLARTEAGRTQAEVTLPVEVFSTDASNQGECSSCSAFAVTAALETCVARVVEQPAFTLEPPRGLSSQNLLDCAFGGPGMVGCDGGRSSSYLAWLQGRALDTARQYPYVDSVVPYEGLNNSYRQCYQKGGKPAAVVREGYSSWDRHTERDIENILLEGHAVVTTMEVVEDLMFYRSGVFRSSQCEDWVLGPGRDHQWEQLRPLRHAVTIVGFGEDGGQRWWKVKNSWGETWGESGFLRIARDGAGHCGLGAHISVAVCGVGEEEMKAGRPHPRSREPPSLPEEGIFLGWEKSLSTGQGGLGTLTCPKCPGVCRGTQPCRVAGARGGPRCCKPLGGTGQRLYCPRTLFRGQCPT